MGKIGISIADGILSELSDISNAEFPSVIRNSSAIHPTKPLLLWTARSYLFVFNFRTNEWVVKRKKIHHSSITALVYLEEWDAWVLSGNDKEVLLISDSTYDVLAMRESKKKICSVCFVGSDEILLANKFGEIYHLNLLDYFGNFKKISTSDQKVISDYELKERFVKYDETTKLKINDASESYSNPKISHYAIITSMCLCFSNGQNKKCKYVVSADREGKICVTKYPQLFFIQAFCLGHTEFVTSVLQPCLYEEILLSCAADGSIKSWNVNTGKEYMSCNIQIFTQEIYHKYSKKENGERIRFIPSKMYFSNKMREILVIVENLHGFLRIGLMEGGSFGKLHYEPLFACPSCLFVLEDIVDLDDCQTVRIFWVDRQARLRMPIILKKDKNFYTRSIVDTASNNWIGMDIGEPIECDTVYFWKHNYDQLEKMRISKPKKND